MKNPTHPGRIVKLDVIEPLQLTVTDAAKALGVSRANLSLLLNERIDLSPQMALRIEKAFGPKMDHLMRMQLAFTLAAARRDAAKIKVKRYSARRKPGPHSEVAL